jgi:hypothetical protein
MKKSDKAQRARFIEAAREAKCSEDEAVFDTCLASLRGRALKCDRPGRRGLPLPSGADCLYLSGIVMEVAHG